MSNNLSICPTKSYVAANVGGNKSNYLITERSIAIKKLNATVYNALVKDTQNVIMSDGIANTTSGFGYVFSKILSFRKRFKDSGFSEKTKDVIALSIVFDAVSNLISDNRLNYQSSFDREKVYKILSGISKSKIKLDIRDIASLTENEITEILDNDDTSLNEKGEEGEESSSEEQDPFTLGEIEKEFNISWDTDEGKSNYRDTAPVLLKNLLSTLKVIKRVQVGNSYEYDYDYAHANFLVNKYVDWKITYDLLLNVAQNIYTPDKSYITYEDFIQEIFNIIKNGDKYSLYDDDLLSLVGYKYNNGVFEKLELSPNDLDQRHTVEGLLTHGFGYDVSFDSTGKIKLIKKINANSQYGEETESLLLSTILRPIMTWGNVTTYTTPHNDKITKMFISNKKNIERLYLDEIYNNFLLSSYVTQDDFSTYYDIDEIKRLLIDMNSLYTANIADSNTSEQKSNIITQKLDGKKAIELLSRLGFAIPDILPSNIENQFATITRTVSIVKDDKGKDQEKITYHGNNIINDLLVYFESIVEEAKQEEFVYVTNSGFFTMVSPNVKGFVRSITESERHKLRSLDFLSKSLKRLYSGVNSNHISNVLQDILGIQVIEWNKSKVEQLKEKLKKIITGKHRNDLMNNSLVNTLYEMLTNNQLTPDNIIDLLTEMQYIIYDAFMLNESVNLHETAFINDRITSFLSSYQDEFRIGAGETDVQRKASSLVYYPMHPTSVSKIVRGIRELKYFNISNLFKKSIVLGDKIDLVIKTSFAPENGVSVNSSNITNVEELNEFMSIAKDMLSKQTFEIINLEFNRIVNFYKLLIDNHDKLDTIYSSSELKKLITGTSFVIFNYLNDKDIFIDIDKSERLSPEQKKNLKSKGIFKVLNYDTYDDERKVKIQNEGDLNAQLKSFNDMSNRIGFLVLKELLEEVNSISNHIIKELVRPDNFDNFLMKSFKSNLTNIVKILPNTLDSKDKSVKILQRFETRGNIFDLSKINLSADNDEANKFVQDAIRSAMAKSVSLPKDQSTTLLDAFKSLKLLVAAYKPDNSVIKQDIKDIKLDQILINVQGYRVLSTLDNIFKKEILTREEVDIAVNNFNNLFKKSIQLEFSKKLFDLIPTDENRELIKALSSIDIGILSFGIIKHTDVKKPVNINISSTPQYKDSKNPTLEETIGHFLSYDYPFNFRVAHKPDRKITINQLRAELKAEGASKQFYDDMLKMAFSQKFNKPLNGNIGEQAEQFLNDNNDSIVFEGNDKLAKEHYKDIVDGYKPKEIELALYDDYEFKSELIKYLVFEYTINNKISLTNQFSMFYNDPLNYAKYDENGKLIVDDFIFNFYKRNTFGRSPSIPKNILDRPATVNRPINHFMNGYIGDINGPSYELYKHIFEHESDGKVFKNLEDNDILLFPKTFTFKDASEQEKYEELLKTYEKLIKQKDIDAYKIRDLYRNLSSKMQGRLTDYFNKHIVKNNEKFKSLSKILQESKPYLKLNHTDASDFATFEFFLEKSKAYGYISYDLANKIITDIHTKIAKAKIALANNTIDDDLSVLDYTIDEKYLNDLKKELEKSILLKHSGKDTGVGNINKKSIKQFSLMDLSVLVMKDVFVGFVKNEKLNIEELLFDKNATRVLIPNSLKHSKLDMLRKIMEMQGIDRISHPSAIKTQVSAISYPKVGFWQSSFKNAKEALLWAKTPNNITVLALDFKNYGEQTPQRESDKSIYASQVKSLIHLNQGDKEYFTKYVNGKRVKVNITGKQHYEDMQELWKSLYRFQYEKLLNKVTDSSTGTVSHSKLVNYILESLTHSKGITDNDRNAFLSIENVLKAKFTTITKNNDLVNAVNEILNGSDNNPNKAMLKDFLNSRNIDEKDLVKFAIPLLVTPNSYKLQAVLNSLVKTKLKSFGTKGVLVPDIQNAEDIDWENYSSKMVLTNFESWDGSQKLQDMRISNGEVLPAQVVLSWNFKAKRRKFYNLSADDHDKTSFREFDKMVKDATKINISSKYTTDTTIKAEVLKSLTEDELHEIEVFAEKNGLKVNKLIIYKVNGKIYIEYISTSKELLDINDYVLQEGDANYQKDKMILNISLLPPEVLRGFGNRIPTQEQSSMVFFEIVGFISGIEKSMLIAPSDFLIRMGSDFDIDTLYSLLFNHEYDPFTGKLVLESYYDSKADELEQQLRYIRYIESKYLSKLTKNIEDSYFNKFRNNLLDHSKFFETFISNFHELLNSEKYSLLNNEEYKDLIIFKTLKSKVTESKMNEFVGSINEFIENTKKGEENKLIAELLEKLQVDIENLYNNYKDDVKNSLEYKLYRANKLASISGAMSFKKFIEKPLSFQNGLLALENKIKDGFVTVLIQPFNLKPVLASLDYGLHFDSDSPIFDKTALNAIDDKLKNAKDTKVKEIIIMEALEKYSMAKVFELFNKSTIKKDPLNWMFNLMMYDSSRTSATIIGAMALTQVGLAAINMSGRKFEFNKTNSILENNIIIGKNAEGVILKSNDFTDAYLIDDGTNKGFIFKAKDGSTYISLGVDDQKNQVLQRINASLLNLNAYIGFLANGFKSHWAVLITNQPIIKNLNYLYLKATSEGNSSSQAFSDISFELLEKYINAYRESSAHFNSIVKQLEMEAAAQKKLLFPIDYVNMFVDYTKKQNDHISIVGLFESLIKRDNVESEGRLQSDTEYLTVQILSLYNYIMAFEQGKAFGDFFRKTNVDSQGTGPYYNSAIEGIKNVSSFFDKTYPFKGIGNVYGDNYFLKENPYIRPTTDDFERDGVVFNSLYEFIKVIKNINPLKNDYGLKNIIVKDLISPTKDIIFPIKDLGNPTKVAKLLKRIANMIVFTKTDFSYDNESNVYVQPEYTMYEKIYFLRTLYRSNSKMANFLTDLLEDIDSNEGYSSKLRFTTSQFENPPITTSRSADEYVKTGLKTFFEALTSYHDNMRVNENILVIPKHFKYYAIAYGSMAIARTFGEFFQYDSKIYKSLKQSLYDLNSNPFYENESILKLIDKYVIGYLSAFKESINVVNRKTFTQDFVKKFSQIQRNKGAINKIDADYTQFISSFVPETSEGVSVLIYDKGFRGSVEDLFKIMEKMFLDSDNIPNMQNYTFSQLAEDMFRYWVIMNGMASAYRNISSNIPNSILSQTSLISFFRTIDWNADSLIHNNEVLDPITFAMQSIQHNAAKPGESIVKSSNILRAYAIKKSTTTTFTRSVKRNILTWAFQAKEEELGNPFYVVTNNNQDTKANSVFINLRYLFEKLLTNVIYNNDKDFEKIVKDIMIDLISTNKLYLSTRFEIDTQVLDNFLALLSNEKTTIDSIYIQVDNLGFNTKGHKILEFGNVKNTLIGFSIKGTNQAPLSTLLLEKYLKLVPNVTMRNIKALTDIKNVKDNYEFQESNNVIISDESELSFYKKRNPFEYLGKTFINLDSALLYGYLVSSNGTLNSDFKNIESLFTIDSYENQNTWDIINDIFHTGDKDISTYEQKNNVISKVLLSIVNNELTEEQLTKLKSAGLITNIKSFVEYLSKLKPSLRRYFMLTHSQIFNNAIKTNESFLKALKDSENDNKTFTVETIYPNSTEFTYSTNAKTGTNIYGIILKLYREELEDLKVVVINDSEANNLDNSFFYHPTNINVSEGEEFYIYTRPEITRSSESLTDENTNDPNVIYVSYGVKSEKENVINIKLSENDRELVNNLLERKKVLSEQTPTDDILDDIRTIDYELSNIISKYFGKQNFRNTKIVQDKVKVNLNTAQKRIVDRSVNYGINGNSNEFILIQGKAGTGKTYIVPEIIHKLQLKNPDLNIGVAALANQAKKNLLEKLREQGVSATGYSIAKLLGATRDEISGEFTYARKAPPITDLDIIIIDEASMLDEYTLLQIFKYKNRDAKVIFVGDIGQISSIRSEKNPFYTQEENKKYLEIKAKSPLFNPDSPFWEQYANDIWNYNLENVELLEERVRQGELSPILPYADIFWKNSQKGNATMKMPTVKADRINITDKYGSLLFTSDFNDLYSKMLPFYQQMLDSKDKNIIRFITYTNDRRTEINEKIHASLFPNAKEYVDGELVIFNSAFEQNKMFIDNAETGWIEGMSEPMLDEKSDCYYYMITIRLDEGKFNVPVLKRSDRNKHRLYIEKLEAEAKKIKIKEIRDGLYKAKNIEKYKFADVDYGYASTAHKGQGSTYDISITDEKDILERGRLTSAEISEITYTALTRPRHIAITLTSTNPNNQVLPDKLTIPEKVDNIVEEQSSGEASNNVRMEDDSLTHINVYSNGKTQLGRLLSNFADTAITIGNNTFASVESWWYWTKMNKINEGSLVPIYNDEQLSKVKQLVGLGAKDYFRSISERKDTTYANPTKEELKQVYLLKLEQHSHIKSLLLENTLPFAHYYVMKDETTDVYKKVDAKDYLWTADLWREIKNDLTNENDEDVEDTDIAPVRVILMNSFQNLAEFPVYNYNMVNTMRSFKNYYVGNIKPEDDTVFVFGSNPVGINGRLAESEKDDIGGAAAYAQRYFGVEARETMDNTLSKNGKAYGLVTVTGPGRPKSKTPLEIIENIKLLYELAEQNPNKKYKVAYRNTDKISLNGYTGLEMIDMFNKAGEIPSNMVFSQEWNNTGLLNNRHQHFGNPFIGSERVGMTDTIDNIRTFGTIAEASQAYKDWLLGVKHKDINPEQREWILSQIEKGKLNGKNLYYYEPASIKQLNGTTLKRDKAPGSRTYYSHADVLAEIINEFNTINISGFQGYKHGFDKAGKGTPEGDGKDKAMQEIADSAIVLLNPNKTTGSSQTSLRKLGHSKDGDKIIMLAMNGSYTGNLPQATKDEILLRHNQGAEFVIGDMPNVDTKFIDYLIEIGAKFTVYTTNEKGKEFDRNNIDGNIFRNKLKKSTKSNKSKKEQLNDSVLEMIANSVTSGKRVILDLGISDDFFKDILPKIDRKYYLVKKVVEDGRFKYTVSQVPIVTLDIKKSKLFTPELTKLLSNPIIDDLTPVTDYNNEIYQKFKDAVKLKMTEELLNEIDANGGVDYIIKGKIDNYTSLKYAATEDDYKILLAEAYAEIRNLDIELIKSKTTIITIDGNYSFEGTFISPYKGLDDNKNKIEGFIIFNPDTKITKDSIIKINRSNNLSKELPSSISFKVVEEIDKKDIIKINNYDSEPEKKNIVKLKDTIKDLKGLNSILNEKPDEKVFIEFSDDTVTDSINLLETLANYPKNNIYVTKKVYLKILKYKVLKETKLERINNSSLERFKYFKVHFISPADSDITLSFKNISKATVEANRISKLTGPEQLSNIQDLIIKDKEFAREVALNIGMSEEYFDTLAC